MICFFFYLFDGSLRYLVRLVERLHACKSSTELPATPTHNRLKKQNKNNNATHTSSAAIETLFSFVKILKELFFS